MQLTLLGTGAAMPLPDRAQAGYLVETGDRTLLVDAGSGVLRRLTGTEPGYVGVDTLLLTHHHLDHVADVCPLLKARWLADAPPLHIVGPPGTGTLVRDLLSVHDYLADRVRFETTDIDPGEHEIDGWSVRAIETRHSLQCYAYRIHGAGGDLTVSGDSEAFDGLASFADGSAVLVHDCSFPDGIDVSNHPTPTQLAAVLAGTDIEHIILSHLYPHSAGHHTEMCATVERSVGGEVSIYSDGRTLQL